MAQRRMFSLKVIDTDNFLDMPVTARLLYYDLSMRADDDGFVNSPKKIMKITECSNSDFEILIAKKYIILFQSGVCVIRHWKIHNYIKKDRYENTQYQEEISFLNIDKSNIYQEVSDKITGLDTFCIQDVSKMEPQVRLGKVRLGKNKKKNIKKKKNDCEYSEKFKKVLNTFPHHKGSVTDKEKEDSWKNWKKLIRTVEDEDTLSKYVNNYIDYTNHEQTKSEYCYKITNFFGQKAHYKEFITPKPMMIRRNNEIRKIYKTTGTQHHASVTDFFDSCKP